MPYETVIALLLILAAAIGLRIGLPNRWTAGWFGLTVVGVLGFVSTQHRSDLAQGYHSARAGVVNLVGVQLEPRHEHVWPPVVGQPYPDMQLIDQDGQQVPLSALKGRVILLEPVGMPCKACVAFAGGHERGAFRGAAPQADLRSIDEYAKRYGRVDLLRPELVVVQVLFYSPTMTAPSPDDVRDWASHFRLKEKGNHIALAAQPSLLGPETRAMIPGFQLIDKDFVLRYDSGGNSAPHDLFTQLLPNIQRLCNE